MRAVDAIEKIVVGRDVIELRSGLIVLRGPILAPVDGNGCAAVVAVDEAIRIFRINPERVMVAMRRVEPFEGFSGVNGAVDACIGDVYLVCIFRVSPNVREIPGALPEAVIVSDERPFRAAIVAAIQAALLRFDERVNDVRIAAGNRDADAAKRAFGKTIAFDALPGRAVVIRPVKAVLRAAAI